MSDYTLHNKIQDLSAPEWDIINAFPPTEKGQWSEPKYDAIKKRVKGELTLHQFDRCAYCRKIIEADGKYEPLEHIVPKSLRPHWMLEPRNLVVTCDSCNNLKGDEMTLTPAFAGARTLPQSSDAYIIFNPHYDRWAEHLRYEDDIFLVAITNSKGFDTIRICKLYRYNVIINRSKELKLLQKQPAKRILDRLRKIDKASPEYLPLATELEKAMDHYIDRLEDNPNYN